MAINAGSSSLKFKLFEMPEEKVLASGLIERIGLNDSIFTIKYGDGEKFNEIRDIDDHEIAVQLMLEKLIDLNIIEDYNQITGVGHRVVAGGEDFSESTVLHDDEIQKIDDLSELAPLHNPANVTGIRAFKKVLPEVTSVAVFDTSFHQTMPKVNYLYSIPKEYYEEHAARKYGAHGTSHKFVAERAAELAGKPIEDLKIITCHLGNGASITAVDGGQSVDTSMGFTPLAGVTMGTRSGDIDASLLPYLMEKEGIESIGEMVNILNKKSGLLGLSGISSDMRDVENAANEGNEDAKVAREIFVDRVQKYIAQYIAVMNGIDIIVFTAGIGENDPVAREEIINGITVFGAEIDPSKNDGVRGEEKELSTDDSEVKVYLIPTDEELAIARDVERLK